MKNYIQSIVLALVVVILGIVAIKLFFPKHQYTTASPVGSTFSTAKLAAINFAPTAGATTTSVYNGDASDRIVTDTFATCNTVGTSQTPLTGTGLSALIFSAATTSTSAPAVVSNTNYVMYNTVSTSTPDMYFSSTTIGVATYGRIWASGSYLTFVSNATNTAVCNVGVHYLAL